MSVTTPLGRLGNQTIRNLATSFIAEKHNLFVEYSSYSLFQQLGIHLFIGEKKYNNTIKLTDNNYFEILNKAELKSNVNPNRNYFQTKKISDVIHTYLNSEKIMNEIMNNNPYKERYNNNNDCFIHIRLGDVAKWNPGFEYYDSILSNLKVDTIYIATDSNHHEIIKKFQQKYKNIILMGNNLIDIIQFGSTTKHVILSYGTFSCFIGYFAYYSVVYYKKPEKKYAWDWNNERGDECNMFQNHSTKICDWKQC